MARIISNGLHCKQSTYNLGQITRLAGKVHGEETRKWLADKIIARAIFSDTTPIQAESVNRALKALNDERRVRV